MSYKEILVGFGNAMWGTPLLLLLMGGGLFFLLYSRFLPFRYFKHAVQILRGKYDHEVVKVILIIIRHYPQPWLLQ